MLFILCLISTDFNRQTLIKGSVVNAQSVKNKADPLIEYYDDANLDFLVITETWLKCNDTDKIWVECSALVSSGRTVDYYNDRKNRSGAGIAIISSPSVHVKRIKSGLPGHFNTVFGNSNIKALSCQ